MEPIRNKISNVYDYTTCPVHALLDNAKRKVIGLPNIQRPFVWKPYQIARLIDSLLHGWPCGNILLWESDENTRDLFPPHPFMIDVVSSLAKDTNEKATHECPIDINLMILDGQQRIQSLLTSFFGNFTATNKEWKADMGSSGGKKIIETKYLCFNLAVWNKKDNQRSYHYLDCENESEAGLIWKSDEQLLSQDENPNKSLVRLFDVVRIIKQEDSEIDCVSNDYSEALDWLKRKITEILNLHIPALLVHSSAWKTDNPSNEEETFLLKESIASMFERLNTAGTPLTKEQIFSAQIKQQWPELPDRIADYMENVRKRFSITLKEDEIVKGFNILIKTATKEATLDKAYRKTHSWDQIWKRFESLSTLILSTLDDKIIRSGSEYKSMYIVWFSTALLYLQEKDKNTDESTTVDPLFENQLVRWVFVTSWSKIWANRSGQYVNSYTSKLIALSIANETYKASDLLTDWLQDEKLQKAAKDTIDTLMASHRGDVREYYTPLLIWMRLDEERCKWLTKFGEPGTWAVDHLIPAGWVKKQNYSHSYNEIGNCWLLEPNANTAKSDQAFCEFWQHNLNNTEKDIEKFATTLKCAPDILLAKQDTDLAEDSIPGKISDRSLQIKADLREFIESPNAELFYIVTPEDQRIQVKYNTSDIYKGDEYVTFLQHANHTPKGISSYLTHVRYLKKIGYPKEFFEEIKKSDDYQNILSDIREKILNEVPRNNRSAIKKYLDFLKNPNATMCQSNKRTKSTNSAPIYKEEEFEQFLKEEKKSKGTVSSYKTGVRNAYKHLEISIADFESRESDHLKLLEFVNNLRSVNYGGWSNYIGFLNKHFNTYHL